ncbi:MFS general substrate transporter [Rhizoctonia solani]|uniref:MFS general substrate transporter n=1 Tax=Rhizoctonia solani TaxID=456999 RepID=A0A8H7M880_9AGAM|nr:MFS general substrate transporter [Rhizoctonia solani]
MASTSAELPESRDLGEWHRLEDGDDNERQGLTGQGRWKGKSKELDYSDPGLTSIDEERAQVSGASESYPPLSEDAAEERAVMENLKRWENAERLRRKAARDSKTYSTSSAPNPLTELTRRASQVLFRSPTALDDLEQQRGSAQLARTDTDNTTRNPFRDSAGVTSEVALVSPATADPFKPNGSPKERPRSDSTSTITGGITPVQPVPKRPTLETFDSSFLGSQNRGHAPTPAPIDLPTTPAPQHAYEGGGAVPARMSGPEGMRIRRTATHVQEEEEDLEREKRDGRWWTDWLCGLKERRDPGGQVRRSHEPIRVRLTKMDYDPHSLAKTSASTTITDINRLYHAKYVLTGGQDRTIRLWNPESGSEIKKYEGHGYEVLSISVAHDNARFASGGGDRSVYLWSVTAGVTERRMPGHLGKINAVAFNADASVLASGFTTHRAQSRTPIQVLGEAKDSITCLHVGAAEIITGSVDGHVRTYDMRMGELKSDFIGPPISSISPSIDNQTLLVCTLDSKLRLMDRANGQMLNTFSGHISNDYRTHACFGHGEGSVLCGDEQGKIWEWDLLMYAKAVEPDPTKVHDKVITWVEHHPLESGEMFDIYSFEPMITSIPLEIIASRQSDEVLPRSSSRLSGTALSVQHVPISTQQQASSPVPAQSFPRHGSITNEQMTTAGVASEDGVENEETSNSMAESSNIPPADRGLQAWLYLIGAFVVETLVWGFPNSFGVFLGYYSKMYQGEKGAELLLPLAGFVRLGFETYHLSYCCALSSQRRTSMWVGNFICFGSLFGASFVKKPWQIVLLQGGGYGLGGCTAVGGLILPLVLPSIIRPYGTSSTLRYLSIVVFALLSAVLPFIRPRLPEDRVRRIAMTSRTKWFTNRSFWLLLCVTALQGFAYFLPIVYLPTFAQDMMLSDSQASLTLASLMVSSFNLVLKPAIPDYIPGSSLISRIALGHLSDILNPWVLATSTLAATSAATFVLWGALVTTIGTLSAYSILFGALAGGFSSLWTGFVRPIARDDTTAATSMLGMLMLSRVSTALPNSPLYKVIMLKISACA